MQKRIVSKPTEHSVVAERMIDALNGELSQVKAFLEYQKVATNRAREELMVAKDAANTMAAVSGISSKAYDKLRRERDAAVTSLRDERESCERLLELTHQSGKHWRAVAQELGGIALGGCDCDDVTEEGSNAQRCIAKIRELRATSQKFQEARRKISERLRMWENDGPHTMEECDRLQAMIDLHVAKKQDALYRGDRLMEDLKKADVRIEELKIIREECEKQNTELRLALQRKTDEVAEHDRLTAQTVWEQLDRVWKHYRTREGWETWFFDLRDDWFRRGEKT